MVLDPRVRARRVQPDVGTQIRDHQRFAEKAGAEMRNDERNARVRERDRVEIDRIAESHVERAWQPELPADADRQHAAVHEHGGTWPAGGDVEHAADALVVERVAVHRRKEANRPQAVAIDRARRRHRGGCLRRIDHEEPDEP